MYRLRSQVQAGRRDRDYGSHCQYLDAVKHWKERYKDAQVDILDLQTKQVELEREIESLKRSTQSVSVESASASRSKRKRDSSVEPSSSASKRAKAANESGTGNDQLNKALDDDFKALGITPYGTATVHHVWNVHKSYKQLHSDPSVLAYHLTRTCYNLTQHIASVAKYCREQQFQALREVDKRIRDIRLFNVDKELSRTQRAAGRTFISLMHGLAAFSDAQSETITSRRGAVVYSYIQGFDTILTVISTTLHILVHRAEDDESENQKKPKPKTRFPESVPSSLNTLLLAIMSSLDSKQSSHVALFEGIFYLLLSRVGKRLFLLTFRHDRCETIEGDIALGCADTLDPGAESSEGAPSTAKFKVTKLEAKYLIQLLERAMSLAASFLGSSLSSSATAKISRIATTTGRATARKTISAKAALSMLAKDKLQRTLMESMFGEDDAQNEFIERLTKPKPFPPIPAPQKVEDEDVPSWFCEQVWRLVGWDLLAREGDF